MHLTIFGTASHIKDVVVKIVFVIFIPRMECGDPQSKAALQMAMLNLEKRFAVVGVMEHFDTSIAMMEAILPRFG